ncbi:FAD-dependent oxidoreductase [Microlunatus endophyticus]|uniref:FAD-dependent oxidoreductase n=1 Tax=Microlunatus endophyticus TaxID=1716077 RepID=A0A917S5R3_9ACTN|nr:FAD-binding oxidoreductase [Microlunatus endophyticus]GGL59057.1 FAD-dependent oxidoreductase [Microlunatus endophyticus]
MPRPSDVIVVGAGIVGAACAYALSRAGFVVTVIEAKAAASGTSGQGEGNILVSDRGPGAELVLAQYSLTRWDRIEQELAEYLPTGFPELEYELKGGVVVATTEAGAESLLAFAGTQRPAGVTAIELDHDGALALEPHLNPEVTAAVHYPQDAQVQPVIATEALLAAARTLGAATIFGEQVVGALRGPGPTITGVRTDRDEYPASQVIIACGPWSAQVAETLGSWLPVRPRRGVLLVTTRMPHKIFHKVYDADYVGAVVSDDHGLQTSSVIESTAAGTVLVGSSRRQSGFDQSLDLHAVREIARKAITIFPFLADASVMRVYGGLRPFMPDHLPVIGPDPLVSGLWHATGHEGAGISLSLGTGDLITSLITGSTSPVDPRPYAPARLPRPDTVEVPA